MDYQKEVIQAVDYIEKHLFEENLTEGILEEVAYSSYHFQRIFALATLHSLGAYIRKRRFTEMAKRLRSSKDRVIDIALSCGMDRHEVFTRSFKAYFGMTPSAYRKSDKVPAILLLEPITPDQLTAIDHHYRLDGEIRRLEGVSLQGKMIRTNLWLKGVKEAFGHLQDEVKDQKTNYLEEVGYLVWLPNDLSPNDLDQTKDYEAFVGFSLEQELTSLEKHDLKGGDYACFFLEKEFHYIHDLYHYIFFRWLRQHGYTLANLPIIEVYGQDFSLEEGRGAMWIMVPIEKEH